jgi:hypothetical protein
MNIEEIRTWWAHPNVNGSFNPQVAGRISFLIREIDRLTILLQRAQKTKQTLAEECERLTALAATHLADQEYLVAMERKRVARECCEIMEQVEERCCAATNCCDNYNPSECYDKSTMFCAVEKIRAKYGVANE